MTTAVQVIEGIQKILQNLYPQVHADGDIGRITMASLRSLGLNSNPGAGVDRSNIQVALSQLFPTVKADGRFGPITFSALAALDELGDHESMVEQLDNIPKPDSSGWHEVIASSFADIRDVEAFGACKGRGGTDIECFKVGDNGIGKWGFNCAQNSTPIVALPREVWRNAGKTGGARVLLRTAEIDVFIALLGDTMPSLENIKNGAGIDTNPACGVRFHITPPYMLKGVFWKWG